MRVEVSLHRAGLPGAVRLNGHVVTSSGEFDLWYEIPEDRAEHAPRSGNAWLVALLPYALHRGERLDLDLPVDPLLLESAGGLAGIWRAWYPELRPVTISAPVLSAATPGAGVAQFFSGGVDSWFTLLRHTESCDGFPQIGVVDDLVTVWGFDIPMDAPQEFARLSSMVAEVAAARGKRHVVVATNLRTPGDEAWTRTWGPDWGRQSHAAALASTVLLMEGAYRRVLIPGSVTVAGTLHWGSHPLTDPMFSTSGTQFHHDHIAYGRAVKIERLARSPEALARLKVCYADGRAGNCSRCAKCHRTLMCLDLLGVLDLATTFDVEHYRRHRDAALLALTESDVDLIDDVRDLARRSGRGDIQAVLDESLTRSRRVGRVVPQLQQLSWRLGEFALRRLTRGMIG